MTDRTMRGFLRREHEERSTVYPPLLARSPLSRRETSPILDSHPVVLQLTTDPMVRRRRVVAAGSCAAPRLSLTMAVQPCRR